jgi:hypothetical protein
VKRLFKLGQLAPREFQLLIQAIALLNGIRLGLWCLPFSRLQEWTDRLVSQTSTVTAASTVPPERIAWAVKVASGCTPGGVKCLARAFAVHILLLQYGHPSLLRIGVMKGKNQPLDAHAWVESGGSIAIGELDNLSQYKCLLTYGDGPTM